MRARSRAASLPSLAALAALLALAALAAPAGAVPRPQVYAGVGSTFAVLGDPNHGGLASTVSLLWPVEDRFAFGVTGFADDLGARFGDQPDPTDPTMDLGTTELAHRTSWGGAWRMDAEVRTFGAWTALATGTWGGYRIADDHHGRKADAITSTGWSLGLGVRRSLLKHGTIAPVIRYHRLFNDRAGRYMNAAVEFGW